MPDCAYFGLLASFQQCSAMPCEHRCLFAFPPMHPGGSLCEMRCNSGDCCSLPMAILGTFANHSISTDAHGILACLDC